MAGIGPRLNYANVMASVALFVALSGTSYAAATLAKDSVKTRQIRNGAVKTVDLGKNAVTGAKVKDGSLLANDFRPGELPAGEKGSRGEKGDKGEKGDPGVVDTSNFFTKADSDARFLAKAGKATDTDTLDGLDSSEFTRGGGHIVNTGGTIAETYDNGQTIAEVGEFALKLHCRETYPDYVRIYDRDLRDQMIIWSDTGSGTPTRDNFVSGGVNLLAAPTDREVIQAFQRSNPAIAMTATVTVTDNGSQCEYIVQATTNS